jgi:predicted nucleic acid-binding protein
VRFWDTSALVPLLAEEPATLPVQRLYAEQPAIVWWATVVECASAIARLERDGSLTAVQAIEAFGRLDALRASWIEIEAGDEVRDVARRMLRVHPLRAADALQLAAAWLGSERRPASLPVVTLDERLRAAAAREGFPLVEI